MTDVNEGASDGDQSSSSQTEWDVKQILDERRSNGRRQYLVEWLDLQPDGEKWPDSWVDTCSSELIARWEKIKASKRKQSRSYSRSSSSSRTPRESPRRTRSSLRGAIVSSEDQRSESPPIRLTRSAKSSPRKRLAVQAFSSDEESEASLGLRQSSVKRRRTRASHNLQGYRRCFRSSGYSSWATAQKEDRHR
ncbi:hypothetical protein BS47DRAFT_348450 [Hydnum rufescens UP504]|uniref:Chromo domain-containing protein n=1 Tax=Hydnum rufescens UP504 TaxID=1448309 RepID=A0A9P6AJY0_9AGAM|nr:hypothetical protein BS47DRAFT_348450 [Hydnum rufescens UP504]